MQRSRFSADRIRELDEFWSFSMQILVKFRRQPRRPPLYGCAFVMEDKESFKKVHPLSPLAQGWQGFISFSSFFFSSSSSSSFTVNCIDSPNDSINDEIGRRIDRYKIGNEKLRICNVSFYINIKFIHCFKNFNFGFFFIFNSLKEKLRALKNSSNPIFHSHKKVFQLYSTNPVTLLR